MKTKKNKPNDYNAMHVLLGLFLGFFLGSSVVYWHSNRQNDRMYQEAFEYVFSYFTEKLEEDHDNLPDLIPKQDTNEIANRAIQNETHIVANKPGESEAIIPTKETVDTISELDRQNELALDQKQEDSGVLNADTINYQETESPDYFIAKDRLLRTRTFSVSNFKRQPSQTTQLLDSLLGKMPSSSSEHSFFVEFWESPLNTRAYKMGKNKIILFGIYLADFASITQHRGKLYLKYLNDYYPLDYTTSFKPLLPSENPVFVEDTP